MLKIKKSKLIITSIIILLPIAAGLILWNQLPDTLVTHWGVGSVPNGWSSKGVTVFGLPLFLLFIHWVCLLATSADPKKENINSKIFGIVLWICPAVSLLMGVTIYPYSLGFDLNVETVVLLFMGVLFLVLGNFLPKCKQSYTMGIKLPWTLSDEENWNKTHRLGGKLWVAGGIITIITALWQKPMIYVAVVLIMIAVPVLYSYILHRKKLK